MKQVAVNGEVSLCMCDVCRVAVLSTQKAVGPGVLERQEVRRSQGQERNVAAKGEKSEQRKKKTEKKNYERRIRTQSQTRTFFFFSPCSFDFRLT